MEDEQGGLSTVSGEGVAELPANVSLPDETLMEHMGGENQIEESYEVGDGGEIMVEIVGSDVFVDGVSSINKESDFMSADVGDFDSHTLENREETNTTNFVQTTALSSIEDRNKSVESELELSKLRNQQNYAVSKEVEVKFTESVAVSEISSCEVNVLNVEMCNPEIEAMTMTSSEMTQSIITQHEEVFDKTTVVVSEETVIEDAILDNSSASANQAMESSVVGEIGSDVVVTDERKIEDKEIDKNDASENLVTPVIQGEFGSGAVVVEEGASKGEGAENNSANYAPPEHLNNPVEASVVEEIATNAASHDLNSLVDISAAASVQITSTEVSQGVDEQVGLVNEHAVLPVDHNQIDPSHSVTMNCTASATDNVVPTCGGGEIVNAGSSEGATPVGDCGVDAKLDISSECKDLILERDGPQSDIKDENIKFEETDGIDNASHEQSFVSEREEAMDMDVDVLDFKIEETDVDKLPGANSNENLKNDGDLGTDEFSNEPIQQADIGDYAEPNIEKGPTVGLQAGSDENLAHAGEKELVEADSGMYIDQPVIDTPMVEVTNDQSNETSQVKVVDADKTNENGEGIDTEFTENHVTEDNPVVNAEVGLDNLVEERKFSQVEEAEVSLQETETMLDGIDMIGNIILLPNEVDGVEAFSDDNQVNISSVITGNAELATSNDDINKFRECDDHVVEGHISEMDVEQETGPDQEYPQEEEIDEPSSETDKMKLTNKDLVKSSGDMRMSQLGYLSENEGKFALSDLVWGKVKSHPWWPGQIFDHEDASEKAVKYYKKDSYLVAYFGDRTFAWNDASFLKPFRSQFSQIVKQSTSETFQNAVDCALEEVSRRVELGLSCSCIPKNAYGEIATQIVENSGIREESSRRNGIDQSCRVTNFEPDEFLQYVSNLASRACSEADRLDVVIAQAQVSAFCRFKGYRLQTEFPLMEELLENDGETEQLSDEVVYSRKSKRVPKENVLDDFEYSPDGEDEAIAKDVSLYSSRKRKAVDTLADEPSDKKVNVNSAKKSIEYPKPSFKIGECIRRVASQLTGSTSVVKSTTEEMGSNGMINEHSAEPSSLIDMLSQLELLAQDPNKQFSFRNKVINFFSGFRSSIVVNKRGGRKRKADKAVGGSAEEFEFDDVSDSYWTDMIVQNYSEKQLLHDNENGAREEAAVPFDGGEKTVKSGGRKSHSRRKFFRSSHPNATEEVEEKVKRMKQESSPAELILNFAERKFIPSEINLNKMFRRFGALMESETEVDHESGRARVIFKRGSDAEVARNSAQSFNIFGPVPVNYQIGYSPLISVKISAIAMPQCQEDATSMM